MEMEQWLWGQPMPLGKGQLHCSSSSTTTLILGLSGLNFLNSAANFAVTTKTLTFIVESTDSSVQEGKTYLNCVMIFFLLSFLKNREIWDSSFLLFT